MNPNIFDHVIALTILVVMPISARWAYRRLVVAVRTDREALRRQYKNIVVSQWSLVAIVLAAWFAVGREPADIGLDLPIGLQAVIGLAITAAALVALQLQLLAVRRGGEAARESLRAQIADVRDLLPRTSSEMRWFRAVAITAGVCEEVIYRGFLIAYLGSLLGTWPAVVAGALMFALGHLYQGRSNALKALVGGLLVGVLFVGCGTLLWPMILHATVNLYGGTLGRMALVDSY